MDFEFTKMHGAGNDFILVDDRGGVFPAGNAGWLRSIAARRTGIGCEGIILVQLSDNADFRMRFYNPDGGEVEMCGNGARCVARFACDHGIAPPEMTFDTVAGPVRAEVQDDTVRLFVTPPADWRLEQELTLGDQTMAYGFVNSGVPHVVVEVDDLDAVDVMAMGSAIRRHKAFRPAGTNANFIHVEGSDALRIRTYERGVEAETLACGTGIVAGALMAGRLGRVTPPVRVTSAGGDILEVDYRVTDDGAEDVTLTGPAVHVYEGTLVGPEA
jgi:diaminopimelate epimerase